MAEAGPAGTGLVWHQAQHLPSPLSALSPSGAQRIGCAILSYPLLGAWDSGQTLTSFDIPKRGLFFAVLLQCWHPTPTPTLQAPRSVDMTSSVLREVEEENLVLPVSLPDSREPVVKGQKAWVPILALPFTSYVILGKLPDLSEPSQHFSR